MSLARWIGDVVGRELDTALFVMCPVCAAGVGEVCTVGDAPLLHPCPLRLEWAESRLAEAREEAS